MNSAEEDQDQFDRLPDALLLVIFNKLQDAESLVRCRSVSKRFSSLVPQTDTVSFTIPRRHDSTPTQSHRNFLNTLIGKFVKKPLQFLHRVFGSKAAATMVESVAHDSYYSHNEVLKNFKEIKFLNVELPLPDGEVGIGSYGGGGDSLLKWKAEFGGELKNCVILAATSLQSRKISPENSVTKEFAEHEQTELELNNDDLKLRVVWIISCLIAASSRHYLLKQIVADFPTLQNVKITDKKRQGEICMGEEQIVEMRNYMKSCVVSEESMAMERSRVPELNLKLWYVPELELPASGYVMKGATLVVAKPVDGMGKVSGNFDVFGGAFDDGGEVFGEAVREMMEMKKTYAMEMNSF